MKPKPISRPWRRRALGLAVAGLVVFHAVLLWQRLASLTLFEPLVATRWLASALLVLGLYRLHRRGFGLLSGRRAAILWLLVLLVHVQAPAAVGQPPSALLVMPMAATAAVALGLALALASDRRRGCPSPAARHTTSTPLETPAEAVRFGPLFGRPPPALPA